MTALVLDSEAMSRLARPSPATGREVQAALVAAKRLGRTVVVPALVLAELYRGPRHDGLVDACLSRETALLVRDTDRSLARLVGGVLATARAGSTDIVDAHVVAAAVEAGGGVVMTGDERDLVRLAAPYANVHVVPV